MNCHFITASLDVDICARRSTKKVQRVFIFKRGLNGLSLLFFLNRDPLIRKKCASPIIDVMDQTYEESDENIKEGPQTM